MIKKFGADTIKFVHSADWQIGKSPHFLSEEARTRFRHARVDVVGRIAQLAQDRGCGFVVVSGDVFESNHIDRQLLVRTLEQMRQSPDAHFYLLPGNHDPLDASSIYNSKAFTEHCPPNVTVLKGTAPVQAAPGVELIGAPWPTKRPLTDLVHAACEGLEPTDGIRIVAGHGAVDKMAPDSRDPARISLERMQHAVESGSIHYVALGDRHSTTDVVAHVTRGDRHSTTGHSATDIGQSGRIWYSGAPEPTDFREDDPGNVLVVEVSRSEVSVECRSVGAWRFMREERTLSTEDDIDALEAWLDGIDGKERAIVRLELQGQVSLRQSARLHELLDHHRDLLAALDTAKAHSDLAVVPDTLDRDNFELSGFAQQALNDLLAQAVRPDESSSTAREALALLYRLTGAGK